MQNQKMNILKFYAKEDKNICFNLILDLDTPIFILTALVMPIFTLFYIIVYK